ncbi:hypothetical protein BDC45DRAFT_129770 [Circinella umbellata]|nr:hypothetical protein BDC45DRAFT_129770 [Circinella umbellata]
MQTRDRKRNFFGGYRHGNKSMPKLSGHTRQKSSTSSNNENNNNDDEIDEETKKKTQIEKALEKANAAVLFDSANNFQGAVKFYEEAVTLIQDVLLADPFRTDRLRLQNICNTYNERIKALSDSKNTIIVTAVTADNSTTSDPSITTETESKTKTDIKATATETTKKKSSLEVVNDMRAVTEGLSTAAASSSGSSPWRLGMGGKRKTKSRPTSMIQHDDNSDDAASAYTMDSTKTTTSLFTSLFAKKGLQSKYNLSKENPSSVDLSSSPFLPLPSDNGPKPSKSTPISPFHRSPRTWLQQDRKKRHSSDLMDKQGKINSNNNNSNDNNSTEQLPPPSLPLPALSETQNNEDYFDLGSLGASDLLLNSPTSRYSALARKKSISTTTKKNQEDEEQKKKESQEKHKKRISKYVGIDLILEDTTNMMDDTMDVLEKLMEEQKTQQSNNEITVDEQHYDDHHDDDNNNDDPSTPSIIPPPRKQSIPNKQQQQYTDKDSCNDYCFLSTVEEECSKSSSSIRTSTTTSSLLSRSSSSSPPLVPVASTSTTSNHNNGQGLSSFWRAHTFSTRRSNNQQQKQNKKHEPNLPPLNLQKTNPPPPTSSRASSTRTRSTSNASVTSRQSTSSSPTTISSPSSQMSNHRNGWSSFDLQSRPNTALFNSSVPSLALSPKDRIHFFDPPKIDPDVFLSEPEPKAGVNDLPLIQRISRCLVEGGYLTDKLYIPKQIWNQTNVRLPSVDAKLAACELLIPVLDRMNLLQNDRLLLSEVTKEIMTLEQALEQIKEGFARKLKLHRNENNNLEEAIPATTTATNDSMPNSPSTIHPSLSTSSYYQNSSSSTNVSTANKTSQVIL